MHSRKTNRQQTTDVAEPERRQQIGSHMIPAAAGAEVPESVGVGSRHYPLLKSPLGDLVGSQVEVIHPFLDPVPVPLFAVGIGQPS